MNFIVKTDFTLPTNFISQSEVFEKQLEKYINMNSTVAVLNAFPVFLFDYYGFSFIVNLISQQ
jgi:hypothetical protein